MEQLSPFWVVYRSLDCQIFTLPSWSHKKERILKEKGKGKKFVSFYNYPIIQESNCSKKEP